MLKITVDKVKPPPLPKTRSWKIKILCFICASEHEGFCVPIFEAIHKELPVIAYSAAAIPYSTGKGVLLFRDKDPAIVAETVAEVLSDPTLRERVVERQKHALSVLDREALIQQLFERLAGVGLI